MNKFNTLLISCLVITIVGCGGGGNDSIKLPTTTVQSATTQTTPVQLIPAPVNFFAQTSLNLPDVSSYYAKLCGSKTIVQSATAIDSYKNNKKVLIFTLWCMQEKIGVYAAQSVPVPNMIVAFAPKSDGSYEDITFKMFGSAMPDLGGIARYPSVADINGDGIDDIVYSMDQEDGRSNDHNSYNLGTQSVVVLSSGLGTYKILKHGDIGWWAFSKVFTSPSGAKYVYSSAYYNAPQAISFLGNVIQKLEILGLELLKNVVDAISLFGKGTDTAITVDRETINLIKFDGTSWKSTSSWSIPNSTTIPFIEWNGSKAEGTLSKINGVDVYGVALMRGCFYQAQKNMPKQYIGAVFGAEVIGGYKGGVWAQTSGNWRPWMTLMNFKIGNKIENVPFASSDIVKHHSAIFDIKCTDLNGDGLDDVIVYTHGNNAKPDIYINDGSGTFVYFDANKIPASRFNASMILEDINGDGIEDLIYWPVTGADISGPVNYQIFMGTKKLAM